jgi:hypothetical protein
MEKQKKLNLGNSDFKSLIENGNYFVDKSLLIKEVLDSQNQILLLPRPRRFGKTLNLSMLNYFFEINQPENEKLFTQLKIWQADNEIKNKRGKYPVIYLTFKDAKDENWEGCLELIKDQISEVFSTHKYLLDNNTLADYEKSEYMEILYKTAKETTYKTSLKKLSNYLQRYYNQQVVILIDEYDTPIQAGYKKFYEKAISFMRGLLSGAFKDNKYLYKGIITGILRVSKESIFSGLNNVSVFTVLDEEFSDKFGFTEPEVVQILEDFQVTTDYAQIKKWYDGYKFGNTGDIYNPWSILNYARAYKNGFKPFWVNTSSDELLKERLQERDANYTREQLLKLINNETIEKSIDENFVFPDLDTDKELLWTLLTFSGYLTTESKRDINDYTLKIPNYEIKFVFKTIVLKWLSVDIKIRKTLLEETTKHLISNEIEKFEKGFKEIIGDTFSYFDINGEPENVYQSYVLGLLAIIGDDYIIKSNRESGDGRYDIMLIPHDKTKHGIVIEIKQITRESKESSEAFSERIEKKIKEALNQIDKNKYYKELIDNKITKIIKLPIVFAGKEPYMITKNDKVK